MHFTGYAAMVRRLHVLLFGWHLAKRSGKSMQQAFHQFQRQLKTSWCTYCPWDFHQTTLAPVPAVTAATQPIARVFAQCLVEVTTSLHDGISWQGEVLLILLTMFPLLPWIARWCWSLALRALWLHCIFCSTVVFRWQLFMIVCGILWFMVL